jgi:hypothetical protein
MGNKNSFPQRETHKRGMGNKNSVPQRETHKRIDASSTINQIAL